MHSRFVRFAFGIMTSALMTLPLAAQTVDDVIAKNIAARGGLEKLKAIQTLKINGKMNMGGGMEAPFLMQFKRPDRFRLELTLQGKTMIQAFDGETGWKIIPFMGTTDPEKMTEDEIKETKQQADMDGPLVDYKDKGHTVELVGKEDMEGTEVYKLKVTRKDGEIEYHYLDGESYMELKQAQKTKREGNEIEVETYFGDFKPVEGLMLPHTIENRIKGQSAGGTVTVEKYEINPAEDDALFTMPPKAAAEQPAK